MYIFHSRWNVGWSKLHARGWKYYVRLSKCCLDFCQNSVLEGTEIVGLALSSSTPHYWLNVFFSFALKCWMVKITGERLEILFSRRSKYSADLCQNSVLEGIKTDWNFMVFLSTIYKKIVCISWQLKVSRLDYIIIRTHTVESILSTLNHRFHPVLLCFLKWIS